MSSKKAIDRYIGKLELKGRAVNKNKKWRRNTISNAYQWAGMRWYVGVALSG